MLAFIKKHLIFFIIGGALLVLLIIYIILSKKSSNSDGTSAAISDKPTVITTVTGQSSTYKPESFPLSIYMQGVNCKALQAELNKRGATLKEDGYFGPATESALLKVTNSKTIDQAGLSTLQADSAKNPSTSTVNASLPSIMTDAGLDAYAANLYNDLVVKTYFPLGRNSDSSSGIYADLASKDNEDFKSIYNKYKVKYSNDLATDISSASFSTADPIDITLITKARSLGLTTIQ